MQLVNVLQQFGNVSGRMARIRQYLRAAMVVLYNNTPAMTQEDRDTCKYLLETAIDYADDLPALMRQITELLQLYETSTDSALTWKNMVLAYQEVWDMVT